MTIIRSVFIAMASMLLLAAPVTAAPLTCGAGQSLYDQTIQITNPALLSPANTFNFTPVTGTITAGQISLRTFGDITNPASK